MLRKPITVLMAARNAQKTISESIDSILSQSYSDYNFLIIDDASSDSTADLIHYYELLDKRIHVIYNSKQMGLPKCLNLGIGLIDSPYIARMDADDISYPKRLEIQMQYMQNHLDIAVCGSWIQLFGERDKFVKKPLSHAEIAVSLLFNNAMAHPSVFIRTEKVKKILYNQSFDKSQDYELWSRMVFDYGLKFYNLPITLLRYRTKVEKSNEFIKWHRKILKKNLNRIGLEPLEYELDMHMEISLTGGRTVLERFSLANIISWFDKIYISNAKTHLVDSTILKHNLKRILLELIYYANIQDAIYYTFYPPYWCEKILPWQVRSLKAFVKRLIRYER